MKNRGLIITLIILLSLVCIALGVFMILGINGRISFRNFGIFSINKISKTKILDEVYENTFDDIDITTDISNIVIKQSDDDNVRVIIYGNLDKDKFSVDSTNDDLKINYKGKKCFGFCFNVEMSKIEVYIPSNYDKNIVVKNAYGDIEIGEFLNADITVVEDCGDVSITGAKRVDVKNKLGDIKVDQANYAKIEDNCGDVKVGKVDDITVKNNLGDIKIKSVNNYLNIDEDCGDIEIDNLVLNKDSVIKNNLGDVKIGTTNQIYIDAKTSLGDTNIRNNYHKSDILLKIDNSCGDIRVRN